MDLTKELKKYFGFETFRPSQREVIERTLEGQHSLVLMPTGHGKSVCFQLPTKIQQGLTLVVSPLIALMKDQVDQAVSRGFRAGFINSSLSRDEREKSYRALKGGKFELMYVTPERFRKTDFLEALAINEITLMAVDEAHCISQWGHDFRPDYSRLREIREILRKPTTMALTATATHNVQLDIIDQLGLAHSEVEIFRHGLERPNLALAVHDVYGLEEKVRHLVLLRHQVKGPIIAYVSLISTLQKLSRELQKLGLDHWDYHGQLPEKFRKRNQEEFLNTADGMMIATPAFGLGIDKSDVRAIAHVEVPSSIESYYQEVGRAGRDGERSACVLFYDQDDLTIQMDFLKWANPEPSFYHALYQLLARNISRVKSEGLDYLRGELNYYNSRDYRLETALNMLERWGAVSFDHDYKNISVTGELPDFARDESLFKKRVLAAQTRLHQMSEWARTEDCRAQKIYEYFDYFETPRCEICDNCLKRRA